jgi:hypothetical protein
MKLLGKKPILLAIGLVVTLLALWYATREVNFRDTIRSMRDYDYRWILPGLAIFYYSMYLRAVRWGLLFEPHHHLRGYQVFPPLMICFAFNSVFGFRSGEVARAYLVGRRENTGIAVALATVAGERILDAVVLLGMLALALHLLPPMDPALRVPVGNYTLDAATLNKGIDGLIVFCAVITCGVIGFMIPRVQRTMTGVTRRLPILSPALKRRLDQLILQFARGFHALQRPAILARIVFHSVVLWLLTAISNICVARGFGIDMNLNQAIALMALIGIFILPATTPGYWGLYEAGAVFSMIFMDLGTDDSQRFAYALMIHLVQYVPIVVVGLYYAARWQVKPPALTDKAAPPEV